MTRPILHRQSGYWTNIASYAKPDLYASLAAVTLPDSGNLSRNEPRRAARFNTPFRGTVARKATDLFNAIGRCLTARAADASHSSLLRVSTIGGIAIAAFALLYFIAELARAL